MQWQVTAPGIADQHLRAAAKVAVEDRQRRPRNPSIVEDIAGKDDLGLGRRVIGGNDRERDAVGFSVQRGRGASERIAVRGPYPGAGAGRCDGDEPGSAAEVEHPAVSDALGMTRDVTREGRTARPYIGPEWCGAEAKIAQATAGVGTIQPDVGKAGCGGEYQTRADEGAGVAQCIRGALQVPPQVTATRNSPA